MFRKANKQKKNSHEDELEFDFRESVDFSYRAFLVTSLGIMLITFLPCPPVAAISGISILLLSALKLLDNKKDYKISRWVVDRVKKLLPNKDKSVKEEEKPIKDKPVKCEPVKYEPVKERSFDIRPERSPKSQHRLDMARKFREEMAESMGADRIDVSNSAKNTLKSRGFHASTPRGFKDKVKFNLRWNPSTHFNSRNQRNRLDSPRHAGVKSKKAQVQPASKVKQKAF